MNVLVLNCGSSSLKFQLINVEEQRVLAKGLCERIAIEGSKLVYSPEGGEKETIVTDMPSHQEAVSLVLNQLVNEKTGVIKSLDEVDAIGHRLVHGGEKFSKPTLITEEVIKAVESCNDLAPLHNPANIIGVRACQSLMPNKPMVGIFDTAFHQTMPKKAYLYGLPMNLYRDYGIRKYGFHGTSHEYVSEQAAKFLGLDYHNSKIIVCHLGNGSSITAVKNGESIDTSMGMTPLEGLVMGTRCGDIDPSIIEFLMEKKNISLEEVMDILNKKSGVFGLSDEMSSDFRDLEDASYEGKEEAIIARAVFNYRCAKYIGSYVAAMNGVDAIVFTAGVGENDFLVRFDVMQYFGYLGIEIDEEMNRKRGPARYISSKGSKIPVVVIPTDEEYMIAKKTVEVIQG